MKRMLENNNEVLMQMFSREMSFLLDAKERQEEEQFKKIDQLIRQQQSYRKAAAEAGPIGQIKTAIPACLNLQTSYIHQAKPD